MAWRPRAFLFLAAAGASLASCAYVFQAVFDESRYFARGGLDYYLLIGSDYVKTFPLPLHAADLLYHSSCGDGPKPPSEAVEFQAQALDSDYLKAVADFLEANHLVKDAAEGVFPPSTVYTGEAGDRFEFAYHARDGGYRVIFEHRH